MGIRDEIYTIVSEKYFINPAGVNIYALKTKDKIDGHLDIAIRIIENNPDINNLYNRILSKHPLCVEEDYRFQVRFLLYYGYVLVDKGPELFHQQVVYCSQSVSQDISNRIQAYPFAKYDCLDELFFESNDTELNRKNKQMWMDVLIYILHLKEGIEKAKLAARATDSDQLSH